MHFTPLLDRVLVEPHSSQEVSSEGGLVLPESMRTAVRTGVVVTTGPGRHVAGLGLIHPVSKPGDVAFYTWGSGAEIILDGRRMLILNESEIIAIAREVPEGLPEGAEKIIGTIKPKEKPDGPTSA